MNVNECQAIESGVTKDTKLHKDASY